MWIRTCGSPFWKRVDGLSSCEALSSQRRVSQELHPSYKLQRSSSMRMAHGLEAHSVEAFCPKENNHATPPVTCRHRWRRHRHHVNALRGGCREVRFDLYFDRREPLREDGQSQDR